MRLRPPAGAFPGSISGEGVTINNTSRVTYRQVLGISEFRALWLADCSSLLGDQCARVALAVLIFDRTGSAALTGLGYALTYLPTMAGSLLMSRLADRPARRSVLISIDVSRTLTVSAMAIPGVPLGALAFLVAVTS